MPPMSVQPSDHMSTTSILSYWSSQLSAPSAPLKLFHGETANTEATTACHHLMLEPDFCETLQTLSRTENCALVAIVFAGFASLLQRYSQETHLYIGYSDTQNPEQTNTLLPLPWSSAPSTNVHQAFANSQCLLEAATQHRTITAAQLLNLVPHTTADSNQHPLFQVGFEWLHAQPEQANRLTALSYPDAPPLQLLFSFDTTATEWQLYLSYRCDQFSAAAIRAFAQHWQQWLQHAATHVNQAVQHISFLAIEEYQQLAYTWNKTEQAFSDQRCIHQLFEQQAQRHPDALALTFEQQQLSYRELNEQANQLAHYLQQFGTQAERRIAICLPRSLDMVVAIIAVAKAGAAYVPLDPNYPKARLAFMLTDCKADVVLTYHQQCEHLPPSTAHIVCLDQIDWQSFPSENPTSQALSQHLAYVIYTSGSTGQPKGVLVEHRSLCNAIESDIRIFELAVGKRVLQFFSLSFDAASSQIWMALCSGAALCIATPENLLQTLQQWRVTQAGFTPSMLAALPEAELPDLDTVTVGAEPCPQSLVQRWGKTRRFFNLYGPTEATIYASYEQCQPDQVPTLGRPIANVHLYVLDPHLHPVPIGVLGELYIGGIGVARGYLNRPDLNGERFVASPFVEGEHLYKTGDQVHYLADGRLVFAGRIDQQVKLRGFRIELGEIEQALLQQAEVREAAVIVRANDEQREPYLAAYIVPSESTEFNAALSVDLLSRLANALPPHLLPTTLTALPSLPLTPNGKLDNRALPVPSLQTEDVHEAMAQHTPLEQFLLEAWENVLGLPVPNVSAHFLALGGDSIKATILVNQLQSGLGIHLSVSSVLQQPTIAGFVTYLQQHYLDTLANWSRERSVEQPPLSSIPLLERVENTVLSCPMSFAQQRLWLLSQLQPDNPFYNLPISFDLQGQLDLDCLQASFAYLVQRHESLRTAFQQQGSEPIQQIYPTLDIALPVHDLSDTGEAQSDLLQQHLTAICAQSFDLTCAPLWRVSLCRLAPEHHVLLIVMHHLITDGWSIGILQQELSTVYQALVSGEAVPLAPLSLQYADFAQWQRDWLDETRLQQQLQFWQQYLANAPPLLALPLDRPRPAVQSYRGSFHVFELPNDLSHALKQFSQQHEATLFMVLLTAFKVLLYRHHGQTDCVIGTPVANRSRIELEPLLGFFVNTVVLRTDLTGNPSFLNLLSQVKANALAAYAHQDVPFEKLVEVLQPPRGLNYAPIFQVLFVLQNMPMPNLQAQDLRIQAFDITETATKFDLNLHLTEKAGQLSGKLYYNSDIFSADTIRWLSSHYVQLLSSVIQQADTPIDHLSLLSVAVKPYAFSASPVANPSFSQQSICAVLAAQVIAQPQHIALQTAQAQYSYQQLWQRVERCAAQFAAYQWPQGTRVAVLSGQDEEVIAALLGALWVGYIVVPLEASMPSTRNRYCLQNAEVSVLVAPSDQHSLAAELTTNSDIFCVNLATWFDAPALTCPPMQARAEIPAYLIYTSGSTGKPKAVLQTHGNALHFAHVYSTKLGITAQDRWLFSSSYSVDNWVLDLLGALLNGACLVRYDLRQHGLAQLADFIQQQNVTVFHNTPTVFKQLLEHLPTTQMLSAALRIIVLGGEAVSRALVQAYQQHAPETCRLFNGYGLTEASSVLLHCIQSADEVAHPLAAMGEVQAGMQVKVVNSQGEETQLYGELLIGSEHLALGYWRQETLTTQRFHTDPEHTSLRWYRTGDMVRLRADGLFEYLGRQDFQLKRHGYRVEAEEIEAVLQTHSAIETAVVNVWQAPDSVEQHLVAYLLLTATAREEAWQPTQLRQALHGELPDHMVPTAFVLLTELPLTSSGKPDRQALPAPTAADLAYAQAQFVAPRTEVELQLVHIWEQVLQRAPIGVHDNFFDLGGHSLLALKLLAQIERQFQQQVPLMTLFQAPSIAQLAELLSAQGCIVPAQPVQMIQPNGHRPPLFFMASVFRGQLLSAVLPDEQPVYGINIFAFQELDELNLLKVVQHYADEMQRIQPHGAYYLLGYCADARVALALAHELQQRGESVAFLGFIDFGQWRRSRWQRHWQNAQYFGWLTYLRFKLLNRFNFPYLVRQSVLSVYQRLQHFRKRELPKTYQTLDFIHQFEHMRNAWPLQAWSGEIHFFLSEEMLPEHTDAFDALAQQGTHVHAVSGFHLSLFDPPYLYELARHIDHVLTQCQRITKPNER